MLGELAGDRALRCNVFDGSAAAVIREALGDTATIVTDGEVGRGLGDTGVLFRLATGLHAGPGLLLLTGMPSRRGFATLLVEAP